MSPVTAPAAGTVVFADSLELTGNTVVLDHGDGYQTTYANLADKPDAAAGDKVNAGEAIGTVGTTAAAEDTAPHLHFAVSREGKAVTPQEFLEK